MNLASWIILAIVVGVLALAVKATFFKKKRHGGCCDVGDVHDKGDGRNENLDLSGLTCSSHCSSCTSCEGCAFAKNSLQPTYKPLE